MLSRILSKTIAPILATFGFAGGWVLAQGEDELKLPGILTAKPLEPSPKDDELQKLRKALYNERIAITARHYQLFRLGHKPDCETVFDPLRRVKSVALEIFATPSERRFFQEQLSEFTDRVADVVMRRKMYYQQRHHPDTLRLQLQKIQEFRLEVQIDLLKLNKGSGTQVKQ
jgi:hypothetical protein